MELAIEKVVDNFFVGTAPQFLTIVNVILGVILFFIGVILLMKKSPNKKMKTIGLICFGIGVVSITSGAMQMGIFS
ncbi:hypothetical protein [Sporosarcina koreensis]|uniref:hypothetical protein n=1 Tax=Bacillales TaxID=1385 RepID=UPI000756E1CC|nr:hypothetical protein [Sporosarcina koreensis]